MPEEKTDIKLSFSVDNTIGPVTDYDVAMAYELFLGRPPKNSAVINSDKQPQESLNLI
ncbi:hypothetical protein [Acidisphaera sp. L21]|jgi:hypothetical protein|uniref:hypothetical protein n=1 Tax=Acidisphaera sp. L21 TaxID=1641851 RepID=UPI00131EB8CF|nr:hypothetical protein [Acidisphaera sp. L21]